MTTVRPWSSSCTPREEAVEGLSAYADSQIGGENASNCDVCVVATSEIRECGPAMLPECLLVPALLIGDLVISPVRKQYLTSPAADTLVPFDGSIVAPSTLLRV